MHSFYSSKKKCLLNNAEFHWLLLLLRANIVLMKHLWVFFSIFVSCCWIFNLHNNNLFQRWVLKNDNVLWCCLLAIVIKGFSSKVLMQRCQYKSPGYTDVGKYRRKPVSSSIYRFCLLSFFLKLLPRTFRDFLT